MALPRRGWLSATLIAFGPTATAQSPTVAAAQIELLALRTSVPRVITVRRDSVWLEAGQSVVSLDSAARALTLVSKPAICGGKPGERGLLRVSCRRLEDLSPYDIGGQLLIRYGRVGVVSSGGVLDDVRRHHPSGVETLRAMCMGRDTLIVPAVALEIWNRDYYQPIFDTAAFPLGMGGGGDVEHDSIVTTWKFSPSLNDTTGWKDKIGNQGGTLSPEAEDFQVSQLLGIVESLNLGADEDELRPALATIADKFRQYWASRDEIMPQEVIDFIYRYGREHQRPRAPLPKET